MRLCHEVPVHDTNHDIVLNTVLLKRMLGRNPLIVHYQHIKGN